MLSKEKEKGKGLEIYSEGHDPSECRRMQKENEKNKYKHNIHYR